MPLPLLAMASNKMVDNRTGAVSYTHLCVEEDNFTFFHRNPDRTIFDVVVDQQGMNEVKEHLYLSLIHI